jgi:Ca2+-binding RTX toxin-like protein
MRKRSGKNAGVGIELQNLEDRLMMAVTPVTIAFSRGLLTVTGTAAADQITITDSGNSWTIADGSWSITKTLAVTSLSVNSGAGDDSITIDSSVTCKTVLAGGAGNDTLIASSGLTTLNGGVGDDSLVGGNGGDSMNGSDGNDTLVGGTGNDKLYGGAGNDSLSGNDGNDFIQGGLGNDTMDGGAGVNTLDYSDHTAKQGVTIVLDGSATSGMTGEADTLTATFQIVNGSAGNDSITGTVGNETITAGAGNDTIVALDGDDNINTGEGNNVVTAGNGNNTITGGAGNDSITTGNGNNSVLGAAGNDSITTGSGDDSIDGGAGNDVINAGDGNNTVTADAGNDSITAGSGNDAIHGGDGNDTIIGGDGANTLWGEAGNDSLVGGANSDTLYGGIGTDNLNGGDGDDLLIAVGGGTNSTLTGGNGSDTFWCDSNITEITDADGSEISAGMLHRVASFQKLKNVAVSKNLTGQAITDPTIMGSGIKYRNFKNDPLFSDSGPQISDITQGQLGDCYFLAQIGSFAELSPSLIEQSIVNFGDGTYGVQFVKNGQDVDYRIDADLPSYSPTQLAYANLGVQNSLWAPLLEKAYAFFRTGAGTYASIQAGWMGDVATAFGQSSTFGMSSDVSMLTTLENAMNAGQSVTVGTFGTQPGGSIMVGDHAYSVEHISDDGAGNVSITVRNPWGIDGYVCADGSNDGFVTLTLAQFTADVQDFSIANV